MAFTLVTHPVTSGGTSDGSGVAAGGETLSVGRGAVEGLALGAIAAGDDGEGLAAGAHAPSRTATAARMDAGRRVDIATLELPPSAAGGIRAPTS
jgi:hypothetical protein